MWISLLVCKVEKLLDAMKLHKIYFVYGSLLTSVVWLLLLVLYWNIQEPVPQLTNQIKLSELTSVTKTSMQPGRPNGSVGNRKRSHVVKQNYSELPDLVKMALINNPGDQKHRNDGTYEYFISCYSHLLISMKSFLLLLVRSFGTCTKCDCEAGTWIGKS